MAALMAILEMIKSGSQSHQNYKDNPISMLFSVDGRNEITFNALGMSL